MTDSDCQCLTAVTLTVNTVGYELTCLRREQFSKKKFSLYFHCDNKSETYILHFKDQQPEFAQNSWVVKPNIAVFQEHCRQIAMGERDT